MITSAKYSWKQCADSISISGKEARQNSGKNQIINLLEKKTKQAEMTLREKLNQALFASGTTDAGSAAHGLATIVATTGTVGGLNKAT